MNPFDKNKYCRNESIKQYTIYRIKKEFGSILPLDTPIDVDVYEVLDRQIDGFVCQVQMKLFGVEKELIDSVEEPVSLLEQVRVPLTWWDAFKEEYFPKFLLKIFQPKYRTISIFIKKVTNKYITRVCPHVASKEDTTHLAWIADLKPKVEGIPDTKICPRCGNVMELNKDMASPKFAIYQCIHCMYHNRIDL